MTTNQSAQNGPNSVPLQPVADVEISGPIDAVEKSVCGCVRFSCLLLQPSFLSPAYRMSDTCTRRIAKAAAQCLRRRCIETVLSADILRDYLEHLPDFEDIEAEECAHTLALETSNPEAALHFFLDWPRLNLAEELIVMHPHHLDGRDWHVLPKVAALLEHEYPLAATILYRALLDDILDRARSKAYGHGAKYLGKLARLAGNVDPARPGEMIDHSTYLADLKKTHPRKSGFWMRVGGDKSTPLRSRTPFSMGQGR